ncbi:hypothetical protein PPL_10110 [Heterostelium album PN500]|uniref:Uncharacterized protein n=1 Tax=Heterostelium pallidum (strain ATCC 26659 / Pp 5 / PN500) TaxID=670386 RepID=D3BQC5_HETP5|nr:hypothetical protein PPL_10110 [Heterostelium album PN500]EFA76345.1 hypothetical protein PPL_10110 [Heterostelium album PN500]|eukprot:XP_020428477.1 hypothetical protein PPL_10110 [Heterostelium album PN500]
MNGNSMLYNNNNNNRDNNIIESQSTKKYNQYLCPSHTCDPGILCRNMFGIYQCGSQYDAYATIDSYPVKRWHEEDHIYTMYKNGMVIDENDDPESHLIHLPPTVEYVLQSNPYEFSYVLRGMNNDVATTIRFKMISFTTHPRNKKNISSISSSNDNSLNDINNSNYDSSLNRC